MKLYQQIARTLLAVENCVKSNNSEWQSKHEERLRQIAKDSLPYGSGFDSGTEINLEKSTGEKVVFETSFHHMNESGYYDGWTQHTITMKPSLAHGFILNVSGRNRRDIKNYIEEMMEECLNAECSFAEVSR